MLSRLLSGAAGTGGLPKLGYSAAQEAELRRVQGIVKESFVFSASAMGAEDAAGLHRVLTELLERLTALPPGGVALVPGGWRGQLSSGWVMHIVEVVEVAEVGRSRRASGTASGATTVAR